jgi:NADH:ubiquinone oxidoreductase subunit C
MTVFNQLVKTFPPILYYSFAQMGVVKTNPQFLLKFLFFLKMHSQMLVEQLVDLSAIDFQEKKFRFEVYYHLLSVKNNFRLLVTTNVNENAFLNTVTSIYSSAN